MPDTGRGGTRDIARAAGRAAVRGELARAAFGLFLRHGLAGVTVDDLAAAGGVSRSTFLRYFASKEDAALAAYDSQGEQVAGALHDRPADEDSWTALRRALDVVVGHCRREPAAALAMARLVMETPALRAGFLDKQRSWRPGLAAALAGRAGPARQDPLGLSVLAAAALGCLDVAIAEWARSEGRLDLSALLDAAFAALAPVPVRVPHGREDS